MDYVTREQPRNSIISFLYQYRPEIEEPEPINLGMKPKKKTMSV